MNSKKGNDKITTLFRIRIPSIGVRTLGNDHTAEGGFAILLL